MYWSQLVPGDTTVKPLGQTLSSITLVTVQKLSMKNCIKVLLQFIFPNFKMLPKKFLLRFFFNCYLVVHSQLLAILEGTVIYEKLY